MKKKISRSIFVSVLVAALLRPSAAQRPKNTGASSSGTGSSTMNMPMPITAPLFLEGGHFSSTITAVNDGSRPSKITVILHDRVGGTLATVGSELGPHSQQVLAVADLLRSASNKSSDGTSLGSVEIMPEIATVAAQLSLTYSESKRAWHIEEEFAMPKSSSAAIYRGIAANVIGSPFVALKSTSQRSLRVTLGCVPERDKVKSQNLILGPQELRFVPACGAAHAEDDNSTNFVERSLDSEGSAQGAVGVAVSSDGTEDEISVYGLAWSRFERAKKLTSIFFVNPNDLRSSETAYTGVAVGSTKTFGGENYFPLLSLTNFSESAASVAVTSAITPESGPPRTHTKNITVPAMSATTIPLDLNDTDMSLRNSVLVQSTLPPGAVATKLTSVAAEINAPILEYQPKDTQQKENSGLHPWSVAGGQQATLFLFNYTPDDQYFNVKLYAGSTSWQRALLLKAMETRNLQIDELIKNQVADDSGAKLPKDAESGEAQWSTPERFKGIGRMLISNPRRALARNFSCGQCLEICSASLSPVSLLLVPAGRSGLLGDATPGMCIDPDCACNKGGFSSSGGGGFSFNWSSVFPGIATISGSTTSSSATFSGVGIGQGDGFVDIFDPSSGCDASTDGGIDVAPQVHFSALTGIAQGATASVQLTFTDQNGNPLTSSPFTITLSLSTDGGTTGGATFDDGTTSRQITTPLTVTLKGTTASSTANNIKLDAQLDDGTSVATPTLKTTVVSVSLSIRTSGTVSSDNAGRAQFITNTGSADLGAVHGGTGVEIVGTVTPSNFTGTIVPHRAVLQGRFYQDSVNGSTLVTTLDGANDDSAQTLTDTDPQSGGSGGKIYDLDEPNCNNFGHPNGTICRLRVNFREWATLGGVQVSNDLFWFTRLSNKMVSGADQTLNDISGDNAAGQGSTAVSWNLQ